MRYVLSGIFSLLSLAAVSLLTLSVLTTGCASFSKAKNDPVIYAAGEKATVGTLTYNVTDTEVSDQLGDNANNERTPQDRFFLVRVSVSNSGPEDQSIPAMSLVDDTGHSYTELADGAGVSNWLGVVRKVGPTQTEQGYVLFDAPTKHYRLRLNDPLDEKEIAIDVPLSFVHEQLKNVDTSVGAPAELPVPKK
jgi:Domain of unknown function (DUF4352)